MPKPSSKFKRIAKELYKKNLELVNTNKELALLQKLYEIMMASHEIEEVAQQFIDVIIKDLGFLSGLVTLKSSLSDYLEAVALSQSRANSAALKLIGKPLPSLKVSLDNKLNLLVKAYHLRKKIVVHDLKKIIYPLVKEELLDRITQITRVKSTIIYPLTFGKESLGAFTVSLAREVKDLSKFEKEVMGRVAIVFGVAIERVLLYQQLQTANKKLKLLDKRKDEFLSVAAHELRAPMTAIKGYLSMILEGDAGKVSQKAEEFIQEAVVGNDRLVRLVNNMLNINRIEEGRLVYQMGVVNLAKVAQTVFDEFKLEAKNKGLKISLNIPTGLKDKVYVDQDRIHEVVANLVSNAVKYTDKGSITLNLSCLKEGFIRLEVVDTGPGISEKDKEKLFKKFSRAESSAGKLIGTGLGLYIAKLLIKKFEGKIGFESQIEKGSTFWFELPVRVSSQA